MKGVIGWFARNGVAANLILLVIVASGVIVLTDLNTHGRIQPPHQHETERPGERTRWHSVRSCILQFERRVRSPALESAYGSGHRTGLPGVA